MTTADLTSGLDDIRVAIQGGAGSWSEESLLSILPRARPIRCQSVPDAWRCVREKHAVAAWLAARNTVVGDVPETRHARAEGEARVQLDYPIEHALLAPSGLALADVARVEAHPHAFAQCDATLTRLVPRAHRVASVDGAHSAWTLRARPGSAVVASARIARAAGLDMLAACVADVPGNTTTFVLLLPRA